MLSRRQKLLEKKMTKLTMKQELEAGGRFMGPGRKWTGTAALLLHSVGGSTSYDVS